MALLSGVCGFACVHLCMVACVDRPGAAAQALYHSLGQHGQFTALLIYHLNTTCLTPN